MNLNPNILRKHALKMIYDKKSGHIGGSFSIAELIAYLYSNYNLATTDRYSDKLILSKGHAVPIIYAALFELGKISSSDIDTFREINSRLQGHPDKERFNLMHATTGSLGQGLSIAIGHAIANKIAGNDFKTFCILGDGECQEGQVWEAFMLAPKYELTNLVAIIDLNGGQNDGATDETVSLGDVHAKLSRFGWNAVDVNGHNLSQIDIAFRNLKHGPTAILLHTVKGKGVSFMENPEWHSKIPTDDEYKQAMKEINSACD